LNIQFDPVGSTNLQVFDGGENGYITQFSNSPYVPPAPPSTNSSSGNNNSNSSDSNSSPTCTNSAPSTPSIFQIWASKNQATMHFVPSHGDENSYTVSYGLYSGADMYNVTFDYSDKQTAIPYTVNALNSGTVYYFKVRANNGCMPGAWSNTLSLRTAYSVGSTATVYASSPSSSGGAGLGGSCSDYTVLPGDSFWSIAQKLLGAGTKYFQLWNANKTRFPSLNSSSIIRTGWTLSVGC
jgi:nucleoid-associated protein YgaU